MNIEYQLAIVAYRQLADGMPTGKVDMQIRRFTLPESQDQTSLELVSQVRRLLADEDLCETDEEGRNVCWELAQVF
ncbi:MAG: hypothetical protein AAF907_05895, partial [Planctomycetota bacterium]